MIRLALLAAHPAIVTGLQRALTTARDIEVLAAEGDEAALARRLEGRRVDLLFVDQDSQRRHALAVCRRVKARPGAPRVVLYTACASAAFADAARAGHVDGVIEKGESAAVIADVIRRVTAR